MTLSDRENRFVSNPPLDSGKNVRRRVYTSSSSRHTRGWALAQLFAAGLGEIGVLTSPQLAPWVTPYITGASGISLLIAVSGLIPRSGAQWLQDRLRAIFEHSLGAALISALLLIFWVRGIWADRVADLPSLYWYLPFALLWPWLVLAFLVSLSDPPRCPLRRVLRVTGLMAFWIIIIRLMLEVLLRVAFLRLPPKLQQLSSPAIMVILPVSKTVMMPPQIPIHGFWWASQEENFAFEPKDGDLFTETCLNTVSTDEAPLPVHYHYDKYGFRGDSTDHVEMVVVGDSFVQAHTISVPFWEGITSTVYALGAPGSGSLEQALLFEAFGLDRSPDIVVMVYFEGNDLQDNWKFYQASQEYERSGRNRNPLALDNRFRPLRFTMTYNTLLWLQISLKSRDRNCPFPARDSYGHSMGYHPSYFGMFTVDPGILRKSEVFEITRDSILQTAERAQTSGATFVLVFMPSKEHVHWPGLLAAGQVDRLGESFPALKITGDGFVTDHSVSDASTIAALAKQNLDNQRVLLAELAEQEGLLFLDLTPYLQQATADGPPVYFYGDTHLNPRGHNLVREVLRQFLSDHGLL
jgi:hypothetical protein